LVLRTTVPAATGGPGQVMGLLVIGLPVAEPDPLRRLALISRATSTEKARLRATAGDVTTLHLPVPLLRTFIRRARRFGSSRITLSVTDVTGPAAPLWLAGARLVEAVPVAPLVPLVPLSVAAMSYAGDLAVSVNADATVRDLDVFAAGLERSFAELADLTRAGERLPDLSGRGRGGRGNPLCEDEAR
jgi:diacylglycerol O-acyltransferase